MPMLGGTSRITGNHPILMHAEYPAGMLVALPVSHHGMGPHLQWMVGLRGGARPKHHTVMSEPVAHSIEYSAPSVGR